jgi:hypothetical protein
MRLSGGVLMKRHSASLLAATFVLAGLAMGQAMGQTPPAPQSPGAINSKPPIGSTEVGPKSAKSPVLEDQDEARGKRAVGSPVVAEAPRKDKEAAKKPEDKPKSR